MPAPYVEPPKPLSVQVRHDDGRWLPGYARGWRGQRVFVAYGDPVALVTFLRWVGASDVRRRAVTVEAVAAAGHLAI